MTMTREEAKEVIEDIIIDVRRTTAEEDKALRMAIEALSSDAIAKAYNQGFVEGSVNATVNSNYVCPRCGEKMERKEGGDTK